LASPELVVEAITTGYGNGSLESCTRNALRVLHAAGRREIPVYPGAGKPLLRNPNPGWASPVHGEDALGNVNIPDPPDTPNLVKDRHAALEIIQRVMRAPGEITLVALGRMTNIALALSLEPQLAQSVSVLILMGGAILVPGNMSPVASANLYEDPEAAAIVYASGASLVQVGLDVCDQVEISQSQLAQIRESDTPVARFLTAATPCLQSYYRSKGMLADPDSVRYNDVPAIAYAINPALFHKQELYVTIETHSSITQGQTVADLRNNSGRPPNATVCLDVDAPRLTELFTQRIVAYRPNN
jgi:inosine-uridine nucleoside N-ribohydrolase